MIHGLANRDVSVVVRDRKRPFVKSTISAVADREIVVRLTY